MNPSALDGILLIDKPSGPTSHDVVARVRRQFKIKKVGHGGTLDPMATGLLVLLIGKGTKISDRVMGHDKTYEGTLRLGAETDSQDAEGHIVATAPEEIVQAVTEDAVRAQMVSQVGDLMQIPPMVSAIKINGTPLYKLARKGETVERPAKLVHIYRFDLLGFQPPDVNFLVECTKGTYVRTLAHDMGRRLDTGAHLTRLRRTKIGNLNVAEAIPFDALLEQQSIEAQVIPLPRALMMLEP